MKPIPLLLSLSLAASAALAAQLPDKPEIDDADLDIVEGKKPLPGLKLELTSPKDTYELGEPIEVTMRYTYSGDRKLSVAHMLYDRGGRITIFRFVAIDSQGKPVRDPMPHYQGGPGGLGGPRPLSRTEPWEEKQVINEWLCFDAPGTYQVTVVTWTVDLEDREARYYRGRFVIPLRSGPLKITLTPPSDAHRLQRIARAEAALRGQDEKAHWAARRDLRFMVDERAIPLLVREFHDPNRGRYGEPYFGLLSFLDKKPVRAEIRKWLADEGHEIKWDRLQEYAELLGDNELLLTMCRERLKKMPRPRAAEFTAECIALFQGLWRTEPLDWKLILDNVAEIPGGDMGSPAEVLADCREKALIPDLKKLPPNPRLGGGVRAAAIAALHEMGDDSFRDLIVADLTSPSPALNSSAYGTLGSYRAREVATGLLGLVRSADPKVVESAIERLKTYGSGAAAEELAALCRLPFPAVPAAHGQLLTLLAERSPEDAFPIVREHFGPALADGADFLSLLTPMDFPAAQELVLEILRRGGDPLRRNLILRLGAGIRASWDSDYCEYFPPDAVPPIPGAVAFFPELLEIAPKAPSDEQREVAWAALDLAIGQVGPFGWDELPKPRQHDVSQYEAWWAKNGAHLGRWGKLAEGIALKATAAQGEYEVGELIELTLRIWRQAGQHDPKPPLRLRATYWKPGQPTAEPGEELAKGGIPLPFASPLRAPLLAPAGRGEARLAVPIQPAGLFSRPGPYRLTAQLEGQGAEPIEAGPILVHVVPAPADLRWGEAKDGLAMAATIRKRLLRARESILVDIRIKNAREKEAIRVAAPFGEPNPTVSFLSAASRPDPDNPEPSAEYAVAVAVPIGQPGELPQPRAICLPPGQFIRLSARLSIGHGHCGLWPIPRGPERAARWTSEEDQGGFDLSVAYEVPPDAKVEAAAWRGKIAAEAGRVVRKAP